VGRWAGLKDTADMDASDAPAPAGVWQPGGRPARRSAVVGHRSLRRGEACGIEWTDVHLDGAQLTVTGSWYRSGGTLRATQSRMRTGKSSGTTPEALWVPETVHTARDLAVVRGRWQVAGMIRGWRCD
jgi:hypothetical protein